MTVTENTEEPTKTTPTTHDEHLEAIAEAHTRLETAQRDLNTAVWAARHAKPKPVTWEQISAIIGMTRQGTVYKFTPRFKRR